MMWLNVADLSDGADAQEACLSSEVSAIYLAMKKSKLECLDEHGQDTIMVDASMEEEEYEEFDDFDPYCFIKNLPALSSVVPTFRPMLLPKQTRRCPRTTLVLDLDGMYVQWYNKVFLHHVIQLLLWYLDVDFAVHLLKFLVHSLTDYPYLKCQRL